MVLATALPTDDKTPAPIIPEHMAELFKTIPALHLQIVFKSAANRFMTGRVSHLLQFIEEHAPEMPIVEKPMLVGIGPPPDADSGPVAHLFVALDPKDKVLGVLRLAEAVEEFTSLKIKMVLRGKKIIFPRLVL